MAPTNAPDECPPIQPMTGELEDCLAILLVENAALRDRCGLEPLDPTRVFTRDDRRQGRLTQPCSLLDHNGNLTFKLQS